ncbi:SH3 domain-containing protein [Paenibacillus athensensis]|uniref:Hydrolase Nlp/P60 n=1 Tax=Paenibacillus athensensis TaxID=1967502 RepID=A0A4Y8QAB3_9BACL|nr:C40 family peptidase [Paenibacillus athensensis]MCD1257725.1 SH3 domain-containing protein [Paenibacillus athensensis]
MKKWALVTGMLLLVLCALVPAAAFAEDGVTTKAVIQASVSFRDQPTTSSNVMRYLKTGETVTVLDWPNPNWLYVQDAQGVTGYVSSSSKYIAMSSNAKVIYGVNLRTLPTTDGSKVIRMLSKGEEVYVVEQVNDSWYKVQDQAGAVGYVSSSSKYLVTDFSVAKPVLPLSDRIEAVIAAAGAYMGTPYEFGSTRYDKTTFDCSDLVLQAIWDATRTTIPSDSSAQGNYVRSLGPISTDWSKLKRGDLMFFSSYKGSKASDYAGTNPLTEEITHVGIYLGNGMMLHTYSPESGGVRIDSIAGKQWDNRFLYGGSALQ